MFDQEDMMWVRHEELLREAAHERLLSLAKKSTPGRRSAYRTILTWLGRRLCRWGNLLQEHFGDAEVFPPCRTVKSNL